MRRLVILACVAVTSAAPIAAAAPARVTATEGFIDLPTYPWDPPVEHPYFRETDQRNIYPYPMLDNLVRSREMRRYRTVVLENEHLRLTFLPELGGKIYEVFDKSADRQMFYVNHVVKPGLIGQCGAWVSGGIEFNTGPQGHTVSAVLPVDVQILPRAPDGSRSVAVGEVERIYRTRWTVIVTLRPGRSTIEETVRIYNRTEEVRPYYFWNCTAVPDTPGFRFIYPMTLGTDHAGTTFYTWPISDGKDLSRGSSYQDAASIFAFQCDQDFFGSYDEDSDYGVVSVANHHVLPGKKAWTWGHGSYGTMHQMDLTDADGPYNEVQTGPLPTQADVGRLDPHEAITWKEWWYPVRGLGGFDHASRDVAVKVSREGATLRLGLVATGSWDEVAVEVSARGRSIAAATTRLEASAPTEVTLELADEQIASDPLDLRLRSGDRILASFSSPLELPIRKPPGETPKPESPSALAQAAWMDLLFARYEKAESTFQAALEADPACPDAHAGLAFLGLSRSPEKAAREARAALRTDPDHGLARFALARAELQLGQSSAAAHAAWRAATAPQVAVPARALAAGLLIRERRWGEAVEALSTPGPWLEDPVASNRLALALWRLGKAREANRLALRNLDVDPLDAFARSILWLTGRENEPLSLARLVLGREQSVLEVAATYVDLGQEDIALRLLDRFYLQGVSGKSTGPIALYWAAWLSDRLGRSAEASRYLVRAAARPTAGVFPHRRETLPVLTWALDQDSDDGAAALYLGHLLFSQRRHARAREAWSRAARLRAARPVALRALALAALRLDGDAPAAALLLRDASSAAPDDPIVARDLARVLFQLERKEEDPERKREMFREIRNVLGKAFDRGRGRSDFVALLARAHMRLGELAETARLLDSVRITIWEGAREAHDLFEQAHLELGRGHLEAGRPAEALRELDRALEYPENLATGRLESAREAHIQYLRGQALAALGREEEARSAWRLAAEESPSRDPEKEEARRRAREALEGQSPSGHRR